ncbi:MAG: hypothetical protein LBH45_07040 [Campylobacteraceae bacterium]|nr:hypothetical protein [Campylobacteraceae bacterium]
MLLVRPKGFGKKYFTLSSIQAHSCAVKLHSKLVSIRPFFAKTAKEPSGKNDPPTEYGELLDCMDLHYCCSFFPKYTQKVSKPKKAFCKTHNCYYGFRRSGIHPPKFLSTDFFQNRFHKG